MVELLHELLLNPPCLTATIRVRISVRSHKTDHYSPRSQVAPSWALTEQDTHIMKHCFKFPVQQTGPLNAIWADNSLLG